MNRWQRFWKSIDEARVLVRLLLIAGLTALFWYIWYVTDGFFGIIETAQGQGNQVDWPQLAAVLTAVTTFVGAMVKIIVDLVREVWLDYRQSGTDWSKYDDG